MTEKHFQSHNDFKLFANSVRRKNRFILDEFKKNGTVSVNQDQAEKALSTIDQVLDDIEKLKKEAIEKAAKEGKTIPLETLLTKPIHFL